MLLNDHESSYEHENEQLKNEISSLKVYLHLLQESLKELSDDEFTESSYANNKIQSTNDKQSLESSYQTNGNDAPVFVPIHIINNVITEENNNYSNENDCSNTIKPEKEKVKTLKNPINSYKREIDRLR